MAGDRLTMGELAAAVVAQDDELRDSLKGLVNDMIRHMRWTMRHGDPSAKTALAKQVIPQLLTAINKVDQNESEAEERAAYERMMKALTGEVHEVEAKEIEPQATPDIPQVSPTPRPRKQVAKKAAAR